MKIDSEEFMEKNNKIKAIIFDMDNTLLLSNIDFYAMKHDIYDYLISINVLTKAFPVEEHTSSTMIEYAKQIGISDEFHNSIMSIVVKHEIIGMDGAGLELGVRELLGTLNMKFILVVVTNNSLTAALKALEITKIIDYFDLIVGREQMSSLKPSPSGFFYALDQFKHIPSSEWISIGDSWIDGKASMDAGIPFISYCTSKEEMIKKGVRPVGQINNITELLDFLS
jgi:phosphoglycolate phosphatase